MTTEEKLDKLSESVQQLEIVSARHDTQLKMLLKIASWTGSGLVAALIMEVFHLIRHGG